ncbi:hypothetical protein FBU30_010882 [Linnemannia zychae]|nr:hypothetical protein FBU30_010882 [Linnemannia zychae]
MSSNTATDIPTSILSHSNESTDDEQWSSIGSTLGDSTVDQSDNQSTPQDFSDDEPRLKRKITFRGFINGSQEDIELLSAIEQYTPYDAHEGACKKRWEAQQTLVRQYEATLKTATGIAPPPSAHMEWMRRVIDTANAFRERAENLKSQRSKKKEEFQQRHAMADEMCRLETQRLGKRTYAMLEQSDDQSSSSRA